jgi:hypothetical protein
MADEICARLETGRSLLNVCQDEDLPARSTVLRWIEQNEAFRDKYAGAREKGYRAMAEEILAISDDTSKDYIERKDGSRAVDHEHVNRSRLRVDTRKWLLSKVLPKIYGDKVELSGPDGGPLVVKWVDPASDDASQQSPPIGGQDVDKPKT